MSALHFLHGAPLEPHASHEKQPIPRLTRRVKRTGTLLMSAAALWLWTSPAGAARGAGSIKAHLPRASSPPYEPTPSPTPDPEIEPGFPVETVSDPSGMYAASQALHVCAGDIDGEPGAELFATALVSGPLHGWNGRGGSINGWPASRANPSAAYPTLGELSPDPGLEVFTGYYGVTAGGTGEPVLFAYTADGRLLPGWPRPAGIYITSPATLADVDGDSLDEILYEPEGATLGVLATARIELASEEGADETPAAETPGQEGKGEAPVECDSPASPGGCGGKGTILFAPSIPLLLLRGRLRRGRGSPNGFPPVGR